MALAAAALLLAGGAFGGQTTLIDNASPRTDENGDIVNAHQGHMTRFQQKDGSWRYYWVGSCWVPCAPPHSGAPCVDGSKPTPDGRCLEPKTNGCLSMKYGACGFNNNNISVYSSATLSNDGWRIETTDAVPRATRAVGEYWQPNFEYNPTTKKYVLWWLYSKPNTTLGLVQVGTADEPGGPYTLVNDNVTLKFKSFTSANLFVDRAVNDDNADASGGDAPAAYVIYSSFPGSPSVHGPSACVQRLDDTWTRTVQPSEASEQFGSGEGMVMLRVDPVAPANALPVYYGLVGTGCCFCPTGADLMAWRASHPLGPWTLARSASINPPFQGPPPPQPATLTTGEIASAAGAALAGGIANEGGAGGGGQRVCVTADTSPSCVPNGTQVPGAGANGRCDATVTACTGAPEQQWRLTADGELQSALTAAGDPAHHICLDASHGTAGQRVYTNFCVRDARDPSPIGQLWRWNTSGAPGGLELASSGTCAAVAGRAVVAMTACSGAATSAWQLPPSAPLPPAPAPPPPPPGGCHGCQVGSCCVPRVWELPTQQQGVTNVLQPLADPPRQGCESGFALWSGDAWQQAPDDLKEHDPQWWVPICFGADGAVGNLSGVLRWSLA